MRWALRVSLVLAVAGCATTRYRVETLDHSGGPLPPARCSLVVAHLKDGQMVALRSWQTDAHNHTVTGVGTRWTPARGTPTEGPQRIEWTQAALVDCVVFEEVVGYGGSVAAAGTLLTVVAFMAVALP